MIHTIQEKNLHSDLSDSSVFTKNIIHLFTCDFVRQVSDVQDSIHFRWQTNLEKQLSDVKFVKK